MLALVLAIVVTPPSDAEEAAQLVARNEAILAKIRTLRATIEIKRSRDGGTTWEIVQTSRVVRSGRREIVFIKEHSVSVMGESQSVEDERTERFAPDAFLAVQTSPEAGGAIHPPPPEGPGGWVNTWKFQIMLTHVDRTYRGLLETCRVQGLKDGDSATGGPVRILSMVPKVRGQDRSYRLAFAPARNDAIVKLETAFVDSNKPDPNQVRVATREVLDFWDLGPGITLPRTIRGTRDDEPDMVLLTEVRDVVCNEPIDEEEFQLSIPSGTIVVDHRSQKYHIWGNDAPARTFETPREFGEWQTRQRLSEPPPRSFMSGTTAIVALASLVILVALIAYRRHLARA